MPKKQAPVIASVKGFENMLGKTTLYGVLITLMFCASLDNAGATMLDTNKQNSSHKLNSMALGDTSMSFDDWFKAQANIAFGKMLANVSPQGTTPGAVIASPQQSEPNYYFHWVRDAALTMDVMVKAYGNTSDPNAKQVLCGVIASYVQFSRVNQLSNAITGLGEPKFTVDGQPYMGDWGRPQNDGPALRAMTLMRFARQLLAEGKNAYVQSALYDSTFPTNTVIKTDLEYIAKHWSDKSFDLWEEWKADHFYTRLVQLAALTQGSLLARQLGDAGASAFYAEQARLIQTTLPSFWDASGGFIRVALLPIEGTQQSRGGIDSAVILGLLHAGLEAGEFSVSDSRALATAERMEAAFAPIYAINDPHRFPDVGVAIGRYPEDIYSGLTTLRQGNPWVLSTAALGEFYYRLASRVRHLPEFTVDRINAKFVKNVMGPALGGRAILPGMIIKSGSAEMERFTLSLREHGDLFMKRIRIHSSSDGSLSEQIDRNTGFMTSARDLTWSYASVITAFQARF
jgi:glucoamylase